MENSSAGCIPGKEGNLPAERQALGRRDPLRVVQVNVLALDELDEAFAVAAHVALDFCQCGKIFPLSLADIEHVHCPESEQLCRAFFRVRSGLGCAVSLLAANHRSKNENAFFPAFHEAAKRSKCECLPRWLLAASAKHSHTTHVLSTATIHYAHHPHYGVTVTRMRKCSSFGLHQVQVALPSGMQILIPEWMLDEDRCRGMEIVERATLAVTALFALRELLDAQQWTPAPTSTVASVASSPGGAIDEPTTPGSSALGDSPHTGVTADHATALPRVIESLAAGSREPNPNQYRGGKR